MKKIMALVLCLLMTTGCTVGKDKLTLLYINPLDEAEMTVHMPNKVSLKNLTKEEKIYAETVMPIVKSYRAEALTVLETNNSLFGNKENMTKIKKKYLSHSNAILKQKDIMLALTPPEKFKSFHYGFFYVLDQQATYLKTCSKILEQGSKSHMDGIEHSTEVFKNLYNESISSLYSSIDKKTE